MSQPTSLTKYTPGSFLELLTLFIPYLFLMLSNYCVVVVDRLIVGAYSYSGLIAVGFVMIFYLLAIAFQTSIATRITIFISYYRGEGRDCNVGSVVWQMIWFNLVSYLFYLPFTFIFLPYALPESIREEDLVYAQYVFNAIPFAIGWSINSMFSGIGKVFGSR